MRMCVFVCARLREELDSASARTAALTKENARLKAQGLERVHELKLKLKEADDRAQKEAARADEASKKLRDYQKSARRGSADAALPRLRRSLVDCDQPGSQPSGGGGVRDAAPDSSGLLEELKSERLRVAELESRNERLQHQVVTLRASEQAQCPLNRIQSGQGSESVDFAELQEQQVEHLRVMVERRFLDEAVAEGERLRARVEALTDSQTTLQRLVDELSLVSEPHARDDSDAAYDPHALVEVCTERDLLLMELDNQNRQHSADIANLQQQIDELEAQAQLDLQTQIEEVEERAQLQANEANQRIRELEGQLRAVLSMGHAEQ
jgi:hypothetical protein